MTETIIKKVPEPEAKKLFCVLINLKDLDHKSYSFRTENPVRICSENQEDIFKLWEILAKASTFLLKSREEEVMFHSKAHADEGEVIESKNFFWAETVNAQGNGPLLTKVEEVIYPNSNLAQRAIDTWNELKRRAKEQLKREGQETLDELQGKSKSS
jgi:hypothetical protein